MAETKQKLPPETDDKIIEVSLKHVILGFGGIVIGSLTVGTVIVMAKDYAKFKRQKAILDAVTHLIFTLNPEGSNNLLSWNEKTMVASSSQETKSKK